MAQGVRGGAFWQTALLVFFFAVAVRHSWFFVKLQTCGTSLSLSRGGFAMSTFVQEDKKGESGKPWIGFAVRSGKGRPGVYICDVVEDGPAYHAGLQEDDQLVSIGNVYCDSMKDFRAAMKVCKKPGKKVVITGRRGRDDEFRVNLVQACAVVKDLF